MWWQISRIPPPSILFQEVEKQKRLAYFNGDKKKEEHRAKIAEKMGKAREQEAERRRQVEGKRLGILQETRVKEQDAREKILAVLQEKERFMNQLQSECERKRKLDHEGKNVMRQLKEDRVRRIEQAAEYHKQEMIQKTAESNRIVAERLHLKQEILAARSKAMLQMNLEREKVATNMQHLLTKNGKI